MLYLILRKDAILKYNGFRKHVKELDKNLVVNFIKKSIIESVQNATITVTHRYVTLLKI